MRRLLTAGKRVMCGRCFGASKHSDIICGLCHGKGSVLIHLPVRNRSYS